MSWTSLDTSDQSIAHTDGDTRNSHWHTWVYYSSDRWWCHARPWTQVNKALIRQMVMPWKFPLNTCEHSLAQTDGDVRNMPGHKWTNDRPERRRYYEESWSQVNKWYIRQTAILWTFLVTSEHMIDQADGDTMNRPGHKWTNGISDRRRYCERSWSQVNKW